MQWTALAGPYVLGCRLVLHRVYILYLATVIRIPTDPGKSWNLKLTFSRPGKSWNQA